MESGEHVKINATTRTTDTAPSSNKEGTSGLKELEKGNGTGSDINWASEQLSDGELFEDGSTTGDNPHNRLAHEFYHAEDNIDEKQPESEIFNDPDPGSSGDFIYKNEVSTRERTNGIRDEQNDRMAIEGVTR